MYTSHLEDIFVSYFYLNREVEKQVDSRKLQNYFLATANLPPTEFILYTCIDLFHAIEHYFIMDE
ncbi:hypothetical protein Q0590_30665 [Rhodocytophaga aerolata]|uniref:Uncharacterized protein n=1 Tax=Rhodocytophaga aerolata TaxID=455078 RepID=A0ABT8REY9_9BACT|nr:hypothetical protein [Rhodocytophaga aerolata]